MTATRLRYEGDVAPDPEMVRHALKFRDKIEQTKAHMGINQISKTQTTPDGTQIYVVSNEHISSVLIIPPVDSEPTYGVYDIDDYGGDILAVGDFVSGVVISPVMDEVSWEVVDPVPDETGNYQTITKEGYAVRDIRQTTKSEERFTLDEAKRKLAVLPEVRHEPLDPPIIPQSQHLYVKASMFSGYMRAVIQLLLGVGIVGPKTYEVKWIQEGWIGTADDGTAMNTRSYIPKSVDDEEIVSAFKLPLEWDDGGTEVKLGYDYRWNSTHGVGKSEDGKAYLVQIGRSGVYAMPFPVDPVSLTEKGKARYLELFPELGDADSHGESIFDVIGGFPSGQVMPSARLQNWIRAGEIIKLGEAAAFYNEGAFFSSVHGWLFSYGGTRADNTCYKWTPSPGYKMGYWYTLTWTINAFDDTRDEPNPEYAEWLGGRIGDDRPYLVKKAKRLTEEQYEGIMSIINEEDLEQQWEDRIEALEELTVAGPYSGSATLQEQRSGALVHGGTLQPDFCAQFSGQPQIKFPEPLLGGLLSFDFGAEFGARFSGKQDTPMAVVQTRGGGLDVINFSTFDEESPARGSQTTRQYCQYEGTWHDIEETEASRTYGDFYTSSIDLRKELSTGYYKKQTTTGTLAGYTSYLFFCAFFAKHGLVLTGVYHSYEWEYEQSDSRSFRSAIVFPEGERNVYYTVTMNTEYGRRTGSGVQGPSQSGVGPHIKYGIIYHWIWHWTSPCVKSPHINPPPVANCRLKEYKEMTTDKNSCFPNAPEPEFPQYEVKPYYPRPGHDCTGNSPYPMGTPPSGPTWSTFEEEGGTKIDWDVRVYGDIEFNGASTLKDELAGFSPGSDPPRAVDFYDTPISPWWFKPSPDKCDIYAQLHMTQSFWGNRLTVYMDQVEGIKTKIYGSPIHLKASYDSTYVGNIR